MIGRLVRSAVPAALAVMVAAPAQAASCTVSPQSLDFGRYDPFASSSLDTVATINVTCDVETAFEIALGTGAGSYDARTMTGGADAMRYNLFIDPQRVIVWGDGTGGSNTVSAVSARHDFTVYGRAPARQNLTPGSYTDVISVTVTY